MVPGPIYIVHPSELRFPGIREWISDVDGAIGNDPDWVAFPLR